MKTFEVILTKSYIVKIKAENEQQAKRYTEFFTGNIQDISRKEDRQKFRFEIKQIECTFNEAFESKEI